MIFARGDKLYRGINCKGGEKMNNSYRWLIAATMMGAGAYMGISMAKNANMPMKKMRNHAAKMTSRAGHGAGDFISTVGDSLADRIR